MSGAIIINGTKKLLTFIHTNRAENYKKAEKVSEDSFPCSETSSTIDKGVKKKCVPTQTQVRQQLGPELCDVFFENLSSEARVWLGLEPPLVGPDTIWINPEARLTQKVAVTPVPEPAAAHLKALTHQSILELGQSYIVLLENKYKSGIMNALKRREEELEEECKMKLAEARESANVDGDISQCKKVTGTLMEHFERCFEELVQETKLRMRKECQLKVEEERSEIASYMLSLLQDEVEKKDLELCNEFHDILHSELNVLASRYVRQINDERKIAKCVIQKTVRNYEKLLAEMRIEMELSGVVDVCQAVTQERIECNERIRKLRSEHTNFQEECFKFIKEIKDENCILQKMSTERLKRLLSWRRKVKNLLQEFQKFINFALKSIPGQSEFLLSAEKFLLKKFPEDYFLLPEDYIQYKNCLKGKVSSSEVLQERAPKEEEESLEEEEEEELFGEEVDFFKCCSSVDFQEKTVSHLNFDYKRFKFMLVNKFARDLQEMKQKKTLKKRICISKKSSKEISVDESSEFYQLLTLIGENEKDHMLPVDCFLKKRLSNLLKICDDDPEFTKIMLGCPKK